MKWQGLVAALVIVGGPLTDATATHSAQLSVWQTVNYPRTTIRDGDFLIAVVIRDVPAVDAEFIIREIRRDRFVDKLEPGQRGWPLPAAATIDSIARTTEKPEPGARFYEVTTLSKGTTMNYEVAIRDGNLELWSVGYLPLGYRLPERPIRDDSSSASIVVGDGVSQPEADLVVGAFRRGELVDKHRRYPGDSATASYVPDPATVGQIRRISVSSRGYFGLPDAPGRVFSVMTYAGDGLRGHEYLVAISDGRVELLASLFWIV